MALKSPSVIVTKDINMDQTDEKVILITGAGRGIGECIARRFAKIGAKLVLVDINGESVCKLADELDGLGVDVLPIKMDVSSVQESMTLVDQISQKFSRIDILFNNAGVIRVKPVLETTEEEWDYVQNVNAKGLFFCLQVVAKKMLHQGAMETNRPHGKIINMASIAGRTGRKYMAAYSASKSAVIMITQAAATELAPKINVNSICPGPVDTDMWIQIDEEWTSIENQPRGSAWQTRVEGVPMGRAQRPNDVADMAVFLASKDSDFITGQSFHVDGGVLMF